MDPEHLHPGHLPGSLDFDPHPNDGTVEILYLLDQLEQMVGISKRVPFSNRVMVEEDQFLDLVEQLRIAIPNEVRQAQRVVKDRERIIAEAQMEASRIVETARSRAEYLISEHGVLNEARQRGEELLEQAEERKKRELGQIDIYAMEQFNRIEQAVQDTLAIIENSMQETLDELHRARNSVGR
jgi:F0F1-type ATP synthase membrane subunit b/b'